MVKKINENGILIKKMIDKGYKPKYITKNFGFKKQKISYWKNTPIKKVIHQQSKLSEKDINVFKSSEEYHELINLFKSKFYPDYLNCTNKNKKKSDN